jgi:hypothetical protein
VTEATQVNERAAADDGLRLLDELIGKYYEAIKNKANQDAKLGDFLKMLELRRKLTPENLEKKELWDLLRKIRREAMKDHPLGEPKPSGKQSSDSRRGGSGQ